jgi:hypothetical protein
LTGRKLLIPRSDKSDKTARTSERRYTAGTRSLRPRDAFLHAKPWQFGRDGRKFKIVAERMRRVARVLARFDGSGECASIFPSVETILERLRTAELNYPEHAAPCARRMTWSRRSVFAYLKRLETGQISSKAGLSSYHGTKRRALHPERLLSVPLESCTPIPRESCTRSKSLDSKKLHRTKKNHPPQKTRDDTSPSGRGFPQPNPTKPPYEVRTERLMRRALARITETYGFDREIVWNEILDIRSRADDARTQIQGTGYFAAAIFNRLPDVEQKQKRRIDCEIERQRAAAVRRPAPESPQEPKAEPKTKPPSSCRTRAPSQCCTKPQETLSPDEVLDLWRKAKAEYERRE